MSKVILNNKTPSAPSLSEVELFCRAAAMEKKSVIIRWLDQYGERIIDQPNEFGNTALYLAAFWGYLEIVHILLERGANPDIKNKDGITPLMAAERGGDHDIAVMIRLFAERREAERQKQQQRDSLVKSRMQNLKRHLPLKPVFKNRS